MGKKWMCKMVGYQSSYGIANLGKSLKGGMQDWPSTLTLSRHGLEMNVQNGGLPVILLNAKLR